MLLVAGVLMLSACGTTSTVPISGRKHNLLVSDEEVLSLSTKEYTQYMASAKKSTNAANTAMVTRVGKKLANAVETYLKNNGMEADVKNYSWEFNLVADKQVNAFCMPGGKIVVYEGLIAKFSQNDELRKRLIDTGDSTLAECAVKDKIWGIGLSMTDPDRMDIAKWRGQNLLGYALMMVRSRLQA